MRGYKVSASSERREGVEEVYIFMKLHHSARNLKDSPILKDSGTILGGFRRSLEGS